MPTWCRKYSYIARTYAARVPPEVLEAAKLEAELACWADAAERDAEKQHYLPQPTPF